MQTPPVHRRPLARRAGIRGPRALGCCLLIGAGAGASADTGEGGRRDAQESREVLLRRVHALERRVVELEHEGPGDGKIVRRGDVVEQAIGLGVPVDVWGDVEGDVVAVGADVRVHRGAVVRGDAVSVGGEVRVLDGGEVYGQPLTLRGPDRAASPGRARRLSFSLGGGAAAVLAAGLWPGRARRIAAKLRARPFTAFVGGLLAASLLPVLATAFAITLIGLPIAILIMSGLGLAGLAGLVAVAEALGERLMPRLTPWAATLLGGALLTLLSQTPFVGQFLLVCAALAGLGAVLGSRAGRRG